MGLRSCTDAGAGCCSCSMRLVSATWLLALPGSAGGMLRWLMPSPWWFAAHQPATPHLSDVETPPTAGSPVKPSAGTVPLLLTWPESLLKRVRGLLASTSASEASQACCHSPTAD